MADGGIAVVVASDLEIEPVIAGLEVVQCQSIVGATGRDLPISVVLYALIVASSIKRRKGNIAPVVAAIELELERLSLFNVIEVSVCNHGQGQCQGDESPEDHDNRG